MESRQMLNMWERWMQSAVEGQQQMTMMNSWMQRGFEELQRWTGLYCRLWGMPCADTSKPQAAEGWQRAWEPFLRMQQWSLQWWQPTSKESQELAQKVAALEEQLRAQGQLIEQMQQRLASGGVNTSEMARQFKDLIEQQGRQFQQMTTSFSDYFKNRTKASASES